MAIHDQVQTFYTQFFPTIHSFAQLFLGEPEEGAAAAVDAFCEYMRAGIPFETDEMPLLLWSCAVESVLERAKSNPISKPLPEFDRALIHLKTEERLAFLLHTVYGLEAVSIMLITGWTAEKLDALNEAAQFRLRRSLHAASVLRTGSSPTV